ncbi:MAG: carbohydrate binding domain-containing protein, partial [Chloroflexota bacterium]|nr:carbohydrate binding domain-containing protein [Chloroflexota bacterium]
SPAPTGTTAPSPRATPLIDVAVADLLIVVNQQLDRSGERLALELDHTPFRTADVSTVIRELNGSARFGSDALSALAPGPSAADLAERLGVLYESLREIANRTLRASITNAPAFRLGAQQLVEQLAELPALQDELIRLRSGASSPSPSVAPPSVTPSGAPSAGPSPTPSIEPSPSSPSIAPVGPSQVVNGGFEEGVGPPWSLRLAAGARATLDAETESVAAGALAARVEIQAQSPAYAGIVLRQSGMRLEAGARYAIRVSLRSGAPRDIRVQVSSQAGDTYLTRVAAANRAWSTSSFVFTAPISDADAVIEFGLGRSAITTWIDEVYFGPPLTIEP